MRRGTALLVLLLIMVSLSGQSIRFDKLEHNFGRIQERDGVKEAIFHFVNETEESVTIRDVMASCGCTTSGWSAGTIEPGSEGEVRLSYDPEDRPGDFSKKATVIFDHDIPEIELFITGYVVLDPEKYRKSIGHLLLKEHTIDITIPENATRISTAIPYKNCCGDTLTLSLADSISWGEVRFVPEVLHGGEKGWMIVELGTDRIGTVSRDMIWVRVASRTRSLDGGITLHITKTNTPPPVIIDVTPERAFELIQSTPGLLILDVRTPEEFAAGHVEGALNVDFFNKYFEQNLSRIEPTPICLVYCKSGMRSGKSLEVIKRLGYSRIYHLASGFSGWTESGFPVFR